MDDSIEKVCECGRTFTEADSSGKWCYPCKLSGLRVNWVGGGTYGRKGFHGPTVKEVQQRTEREATAKGVKWRKQSTRAELI